MEIDDTNGKTVQHGGDCSTTGTGTHKSCQEAYTSGHTQSGVYNINPGSCMGSSMQVYCDMSNGGGWAMVATIDGNDQEHSNVNAVGASLITPTTSTTSKYSDSVIQCLQSADVVNGAGTRFVCRSETQFFKGCSWSAVAGVGDGATENDKRCITSYNDEAATSLRSDATCNAGSQGVGAHCQGNPSMMDSYCSHCPNGDAAGGHNRMGCGHDNNGYGHAGALYVR